MKIVDPLSGEELPDGRSGELCCRGHDVMLGYYNMPEATAQAIDAEGWLHTGDLALRQPDGYFRITGRMKEMIIRGGENIAPREIEELLFQHPKVEQVSVVGVPDRRFGEEILAWIKLRAGESATAEEIRDFCRERLAHFKTPRYVQVRRQLPHHGHRKDSEVQDPPARPSRNWGCTRRRPSKRHERPQVRPAGTDERGHNLQNTLPCDHSRAQ